MEEAARTLVLVLLLGCPDGPGICSAQYMRCEDKIDCAFTRAALWAKYKVEDRFARVDMAWHADWPPGLLVWGMPTPRSEVKVYGTRRP